MHIAERFKAVPFAISLQSDPKERREFLPGYSFRPKKKIVCFRSPDRPYFEAPTLNFFLAVKIRFSQINIFQFSDDYFGSQKRFTDRL